jgi:hypothetical protein
MARAKMSAEAETRTESPRTDTSESEIHEEIAILAYQFWQERGCPIGSPEEDWFRAKQALQALPENREDDRTQLGIHTATRTASEP